MISHPSPPDATAFARAVLSAAAEVEAAEAGIKRAIMDAARAGDTLNITHPRWCPPEVSP